MTTIGIVGGKGRMGAAFAEFFKAQGYKVLISDRHTALSNKQLAKKSDVVIVSVPIDATIKIIEGIAPHMKKSALMMDLTSVKEPAVKAMLRSRASVIGAHPMCNETTFGPGQTLIYCPARPGKWAKWFKETFETKGGLHIYKLTAAKHDQIMSFAQAMIHFSEFAIGKTLQTLNPDLKSLLTFASPASQLKIKVAARHLAQDPNLYGNIQIQNPRNPKVLNAYREAVSELCQIVEHGDLKAFTTYFKEGSKYFGDFSKEAFKETDGMINRMIESKIPEIPKKIPKNGIASLGPDFTYSSIASRKWRGSSKREIVFVGTISEIAKLVGDGKVNEGLMPIENRLQGTVRETLDALFKEKIFIKSELSIPIHHCLAVQKGVKPSDVATIMSHPQALNQCRDHLRKKFPKAKWITTDSTAAAFEHVHKNKDNSVAVVGPEIAAKHYELKVLAKNIENDGSNETRFIVVTGKQPKVPAGRKLKTSIIFYFPKDKPGSLFSVFQIFNDLGINLTHIESRPAPKKLGEYLFYLDFEGSPKAKKGAEALKRVNKVAAKVKILGTY